MANLICWWVIPGGRLECGGSTEVMALHMQSMEIVSQSRRSCVYIKQQFPSPQRLIPPAKLRRHNSISSLKRATKLCASATILRFARLTADVNYILGENLKCKPRRTRQNSRKIYPVACSLRRVSLSSSWNYCFAVAGGSDRTSERVRGGKQKCSSNLIKISYLLPSRVKSKSQWKHTEAL